MSPGASSLRAKLTPGRSRFLEWALMLCVISILLGVLLVKMRSYQADVEFGAFRYTVGALRTALIIERLRFAVQGEAKGAPANRGPFVRSPQAETPRLHNPFLLLKNPAEFYFGEIAVGRAAASVPPGEWFYDPACPCIGYHARFPEQLISVSGSPILLFSINAEEGKGLGVPVLSAYEPYIWHGVRIE